MHVVRASIAMFNVHLYSWRLWSLSYGIMTFRNTCIYTCWLICDFASLSKAGTDSQGTTTDDYTSIDMYGTVRCTVLRSHCPTPRRWIHGAGMCCLSYTPLIDDDRCSYHLLLVCVTPCSRTLFCLWSLSLLTNVSNFALRMGGILGNLKFS